MKVGPITATLWYLTTMLHIILVFLLVRRRTYRELPIFCTLVVAATICGAVMQVYSAKEWAMAYYYFYWISRVTQLVLGVALIHELLRQMLYGYDGIRTVAATTYWVAVVLLLGGAALTAANLPNRAWDDTLTRMLFVLERSLLFIQAGLIVVLFSLVALFGLQWRKLVFGVAFGFGIYAAFKLLLFTAYSYLGQDYYGPYVVILMANGLVPLAVWIAYVAVPEREPQPQPLVANHDLER